MAIDQCLDYLPEKTSAYDKLKYLFERLKYDETLYFVHGFDGKKIEYKVIGFKYEGLITEHKRLNKARFDLFANQSYKIVKVVDEGDL